MTTIAIVWESVLDRIKLLLEDKLMPRHSYGKMMVIIGLLLVLSNDTWSQTPPVPVIFDTDMAEDVDDTGALALLHALADQGETQILATIVSARNEFVVPCLDAINTYYGRPDIAIGYVGKAGVPVKSKYVEQVARDSHMILSPAALRRMPSSCTH